MGNKPAIKQKITLQLSAEQILAFRKAIARYGKDFSKIQKTIELSNLKVSELVNFYYTFWKTSKGYEQFKEARSYPHQHQNFNDIRLEAESEESDQELHNELPLAHLIKYGRGLLTPGK